jgi:glycosyltransferase involved in cell wall biosynthesis
VLLDYRPALRERTGVGQYVHEAARHLVATAPPGETLVLFSASWRDRLTPDVIPGAGVVDRRMPVAALNLAWHRLEWPPIEWVTGGGFDVVQSLHPLLLPSRRAARVITIHDLDFLDHPERTVREIRRDYPALARSHARRADQIVVNSRHTAGAVAARFDVPIARISICPPGAPDWPRREAEPASGGCILFLGTLSARKNPGVLLDAYERLIAAMPAAPPLALVGRVEEDAAPLAARVRRPPLAGRVELPGYVDDQARRDWFSRALVFVLPSHAEGFGMPVVEAMTAGVPVLAANAGALPEVAGDAGRLIPPDDPAALAAALGEMLADRSLRDRLREAGWRQAGRFTWSRTAAGLRDAWQRAIDHRRERHA